MAVADIEFEQFHPTALHHPVMPRPLLTEALRGHGALLRDAKGERFVDELLSRDKVSRAITARMLEQDVEHLWLDATGLERFAERFPTIAAELAKVGLDPAEDWLPIAPAAHYSCGGILADLDGASSLPGLWVAGEASCNGVMGANRLASNSLLDGMVFGPRVVEAIDRGVDGPRAHRRDAMPARRRRDRRPSDRGPASRHDRRARPRHPAAHDDHARRRAPLGRRRCARPPTRAPARSPATTPGRGSCATSPPWAACCARRRSLARRAAARTPAPSSTATRDELRLRFVAGG